MERLVNDYKDKPNYYVLVVSHSDHYNADIIRTKLILLKEKPAQPMVGTMLYYVDNRQGRLERIYVLPRDVVRPEGTVAEDDFSDEIFYHGKAPNK